MNAVVEHLPGHAGGAEDAVLRVVGLVISVHVAGMYLFSPLVGVLGNDATAMAVVILGAALAATAVLLVVVRPWQLGPVDVEPADH